MVLCFKNKSLIWISFFSLTVEKKLDLITYVNLYGKYQSLGVYFPIKKRTAA